MLYYNIYIYKKHFRLLQCNLILKSCRARFKFRFKYDLSFKSFHIPVIRNNLNIHGQVPDNLIKHLDAYAYAYIKF